MTCTTDTSFGKIKGTLLNRYSGEIKTFLEKYNCSEKNINKFNNKHFCPVEVYRGVPYAKKPVGDSALKQVLKLDESDTFEGLDFDQLSPVSLQDAMMAQMASDPSRRTDSCFSTHLDLLGGNRYQMSRDCLTMDIYKPVTEKKDLPVFVWIHGGGFVSGSKQEYNGSV